MPRAVKYIVDDCGQKTSVLVPIKAWGDLDANCKILQNKLEIFISVREGLEEVKRAKKSGRKLQTLKEFLK